MAKKLSTFTNKHSVISAKDLRNIAQRAVDLSGNSRTIRVEYPFANGLQMDILYTDIKDLFTYAMAYGVLMNEVDPHALIENRRFADCTFFCCANCLKVGKEHQNKLMRNFCNDCAKEHQEEHLIKVTKFWEDFDVRNKPVIKNEEVFSSYIQEQKIKEKIKSVSPVKLKFNPKNKTK